MPEIICTIFVKLRRFILDTNVNSFFISYTLSLKTCHFISDYNSSVSWWILQRITHRISGVFTLNAMRRVGRLRHRCEKPLPWNSRILGLVVDTKNHAVEFRWVAPRCITNLMERVDKTKLVCAENHTNWSRRFKDVSNQQSNAVVRFGPPCILFGKPSVLNI